MSCGSTDTVIVNSWKDPESNAAKEQFKKVMVVALLKDERTRRNTENTIVANNPIFHSSYAFLNGATVDLTKEQRLSILKSENYDGVITMRLVNMEKETNYVPGTYSDMYYGGMGYGYGYGFDNWYGYYSPNFYTPGYYQENTHYIVETNVFSLNQNKLIWTGTTKSTNITDVETTTNNIMIEVVKQMEKDGFLDPKRK
ncbi:hypothetical protein FLJC2902T_24560 [Flavobacterium limnosediminis JC2902]|uniref:DUF4136 domain-containing protein n=2 Tax=Flavobacterium TaxID=237 RepID=V6SPX6_9FLAO|nr:hypothetical protein FLJC2902T_24560 [Flavobacterium limnosediminis JC2902]